MEILIKAKQGSNPQFSFLNQNDKLYKFYRHVLVAFKNGRYQGYGPEPLNKTGECINNTMNMKLSFIHNCNISFFTRIFR